MPQTPLLTLLAQCCAALNAGRDAEALRLIHVIARRTGRPIEITSSAGGRGISILGKP